MILFLWITPRQKMVKGKQVVYFPIKIKYNENGKWINKLCKTPQDVPAGKAFHVMETQVKD